MGTGAAAGAKQQAGRGAAHPWQAQGQLGAGCHAGAAWPCMAAWNDPRPQPLPRNRPVQPLGAPLASRGPLGITTLTPGMCVKKASGDWEW